MYLHGIKARYRIKTWVLGLIDLADRELCMEEDEFAYRVQWTVTKAGFGARRYRDPRFDQLKADRPHPSGHDGHDHDAAQAEAGRGVTENAA
jgi:hypothetical protein